jgi:hypothetical protein
LKEISGLEQNRFTNTAELINKLHRSIGEIKNTKAVSGWVPAKEVSDSILAGSAMANSDRVYLQMHIEASYFNSPSRPGRLDMKYRSKRIVKCISPDGLAFVQQDFTLDNDRLVKFAAGNRPDVELVDWKRSSGGTAQLMPPAKSSGGSYIQDIRFNPPLRMDEIAEVELAANLREYRLAYSEDLISSTSFGRMGPRSFDFHARNVGYPTEHLVMTVFLADETGAVAVGPKSGSRASTDSALNARLLHDSYKQWRGDLDGRPGTFMELNLLQPQLNVRYRLAWELPARPVST